MPDPAAPIRAPLEIPVPGLIVLIGAAGAGKSTLARRLFADADILSSDALRAALSGDPADQGATRPAFAILHRQVRLRLAAGRLVVVDATNVESSARAALRRLARAAAVPSVAIAIAAPGSDVHARNAARVGRVVPADVVDHHLGRLARLGDPATLAAGLIGEGFTAAHVLVTTADLDQVAVVRVPLILSGGSQPSLTRPKARTRTSTQTPLRR